MPHSTTIPAVPNESAALRAVRGSAIRNLLAVTEQPEMLSLAGGLPATDLIPTDRIADAAARVMGRPGALQYTTSRGASHCRDAVAMVEGVDPSRILLTHGSQQALSLLAQAIIDPDDVVVVDDPVYVGALQAFQCARAAIVALPITNEGTNVAALVELLEGGTRPRLVHTVNNFHNPSGITASTSTREQLADLAERYGFWIVEDDPYGRLGFRSAPPAPIPGGRTIRLGSASKTLAPALRVGWLNADPGVVALIERLKQCADLCGSTLNQLMVADLLADTAWFDAHVRAVTSEYSSRAQSLASALDDEFGDSVEYAPPSGGMFCWVRLPDVDTDKLLNVAVSRGVAFVPGSAFAVNANLTDCARLSFATLQPDGLREAVRRLGTAVNDN
ncbi:aminotransferase-like domain-containing protein [Gordonia sputi]|uniref:aminotransferase-like domain-containing protein n=1 Tax=Gordonia sputi TaxID=36823 RepID=UPI00226F8CC9|nr:PLP-dependent aminotransferase family protein [Gordonia sputi]